MTDPVASRSQFLCMYMSNHPDTLVAYVKHFGRISTPVVSARMTSIDTKGMTLSYLLKGDDTKQQVTVPFEPHLSGYDEVKPRLLGMKVDAEDALGMTKRPQITSFEIPRDALVTVAMLLLFIYVTFSVPRPQPSLHNIGPWIRAVVGGYSTIRYIWAFAVSIHLGEALYAILLCKRHATGPITGAKWTIAIFFLGYPVLFKLRHLIQKARIDSITKIH